MDGLVHAPWINSTSSLHGDNGMSIFDVLPVQYKTYFESMLPWKQNAPLTQDDLSPAIIEAMKNDAINAYQTTGNLSGRIYGTADEDLWETLGKYDYNINRPSAPNFEATVDFEDVYSWKPEYSSHGRIGPNGTDADLPMVFRGLGNAITGNIPFRNAAEILGSYVGPRETSGEGRNLNFNVPIDSTRLRKNSVPFNKEMSPSLGLREVFRNPHKRKDVYGGL